MTFPLSPALDGQLGQSPTLHINERVRQMWAAGERVYHLGFGESRFPTHPKILRALAENADRRSYLPAVGIPELRRAVAEFHSRQLGRAISPEQVIVGPGSKALLFAFQMAAAGATVLPTPSWVSYAPQARLIGRPILRIPSSPHDGHRLHPAKLQEILRQSLHEHHLLILNSPNNPTGGMLEPALLEEIAAICRRQNVLSLSDEIYALTAYGRDHASLSSYYPEGTIVLGGISKHLSLGGWRLGTAIVPPGQAGRKLLQAVAKVSSELWSTPSAPIQVAAVTAYARRPGAQRLHRPLYKPPRRPNPVTSGVASQSWTYIVLNRWAGSTFTPDFNHWRGPLARKGVHTSNELAAYLLDTCQIATLPGTDFGAPEQELSLRLSTSYVDLETDQKAANMMALADGAVDEEALMRRHHPGMNELLDRFRNFLASL